MFFRKFKFLVAQALVGNGSHPTHISPYSHLLIFGSAFVVRSHRRTWTSTLERRKKALAS